MCIRDRAKGRVAPVRMASTACARSPVGQGGKKQLQRRSARGSGICRERARRPLVVASLCPRSQSGREREPRSLDRWIAVNQGTIETQFARRALTPHRALDMPLTTAALDQITRPISAALYPRRYALKNRERLNRLLMLLQLHINGDDDVQAYARAIRLHLEANGGRPLAHRRALTDPLNSPSLRLWPNEMRGPGHRST